MDILLSGSKMIVSLLDKREFVECHVLRTHFSAELIEEPPQPVVDMIYSTVNIF